MIVTKAILVIWLGAGNTQTFDTQKFDSEAECKAARYAMIMKFEEDSSWYANTIKKGSVCISYTFEEVK